MIINLIIILIEGMTPYFRRQKQAYKKRAMVGELSAEALKAWVADHPKGTKPSRLTGFLATQVIRKGASCVENGSIVLRSGTIKTTTQTHKFSGVNTGDIVCL